MPPFLFLKKFPAFSFPHLRWTLFPTPANPFPPAISSGGDPLPPAPTQVNEFDVLPSPCNRSVAVSVLNLFPFLDLVVWCKESLFLSFRYSFRISMFRCDRFWALLMVLRVDDLICGGAVFLCDVSNFSCIMWGYDFVAESEVECGWIVWIRC